MRLVKSILVASLGLSLTMFGADAFAAKKKKKKKKKPATEEMEGGGEEMPAGEEGGDAMASGGGGGAWAPYGMAGCGLGSIIMKNNSKMMQIMAATSNGTGGSQTFGITSGTSNCKAPSAAEARKMEQEAFIATNLKWLEKDAARGHGDMLKAFAEMLGCNQSQYPSFAAASQEHHAELFNSSQPKEILTNYLEMVNQNETLARVCPGAV